MLPALLLLAAAVHQQERPTAHVVRLLDPDGGSHLQLRVQDIRLEPPKLSPKAFGEEPATHWEFDWSASGFGLAPGTTDNTLNVRMRVFSQDHKENGRKMELVARMAMRIWDMNLRRLQIDHSPNVNSSIVDFYLCWGGKAGGEQLWDTEIDPSNHTVKVNTIYIYDLPSFNSPVEMAREVAHEYGHATLPAVGGFQTPEDWANGYLGEKIYLRWIRDDYANGRLFSGDVMDAPLQALDNWVKTKVDPLVLAAASAPPNLALLGDHGPAAMNAYIGLALYAERILPHAVFARSMKIIGSTHASDYPASILAAVAEKEAVVLDIPKELAGKPLWIPLGEGKISGASVTTKRDGWALITPQVGGVTITNRKQS